MTIPEPTVQACKYLISLLPEGHDDRYLYTVQVEYRGNDLWAITNRTRYLAADGTWTFGFAWSEGDAEPSTDAEIDRYHQEFAAWKAARRFDLDTALSLAKNAARALSYRGETASDVYQRTNSEES